MPWPTMLSVLRHHGEAANPELLIWIKQLLDHILGSSEWIIVAVVAVALVTFPVGLILFYLSQLRRERADTYQASGDGQ
ncbi:MAG: hypothetical protein CMJ45_07230 [Planctomyces sp.]|nr:hypothetical protein [Planctomyces sp.]